MAIGARRPPWVKGCLVALAVVGGLCAMVATWVIFSYGSVSHRSPHPTAQEQGPINPFTFVVEPEVDEASVEFEVALGGGMEATEIDEIVLSFSARNPEAWWIEADGKRSPLADFRCSGARCLGGYVLGVGIWDRKELLVDNVAPVIAGVSPLRIVQGIRLNDWKGARFLRERGKLGPAEAARLLVRSYDSFPDDRLRLHAVGEDLAVTIQDEQMELSGGSVLDLPRPAYCSDEACALELLLQKAVDTQGVASWLLSDSEPGHDISTEVPDQDSVPPGGRKTFIWDADRENIRIATTLQVPVAGSEPSPMLELTLVAESERPTRGSLVDVLIEGRRVDVLEVDEPPISIYPPTGMEFGGESIVHLVPRRDRIHSFDRLSLEVSVPDSLPKPAFVGRVTS